MMKYTGRHSFLRACMAAGAGIFFAGALFSCANIGHPGGGPKDETPPVVKKCEPEPGTLNYNSNKINVDFDEIIQIDNPNEKVIISPPQSQMPRILTSGRRVSVTLNDSLLPNTTYTIDFGDAIADNNEKNKLGAFSLYFSTGDHIDTLEIAGTLLNASNLEPVSDMTVGIYANLDDTAFTSLPFLRIARTDAYGHFTIHNIAEGSYRIFALKDGNRNYFFDNPAEDIAFGDSLIFPTVQMEWRTDTIWADSVTIDTMITALHPHYYPDDLVLLAFNENFKSHYFEKYERNDRRKVTVYFSAPQDSLPRITPLNFADGDWAVVESSATCDTITYWLRDSLVYGKDTLQIAAAYYRTDSAQQLSLYNDTMTWIFRDKTVRKVRKPKENDTLPPPIEFMAIANRNGTTIDIPAVPVYTFDQPVRRLAPDAVHLDLKVDTLWTPVTDYTFVPDSGSTRTYRLHHKWNPGSEYRLTLDSLAAESIYGTPTNTLEHRFKVRAVEEYSNLIVKTAGVEEGAFAELLSASDMPRYTSRIKNGRAIFRYLMPGTYYMRLCIDANENGVWDTGNYKEKRQPETVLYYPGNIALRANWDVEQTWDVYATPLTEQKPREIVKNKPQEKKSEDTDEEEKETSIYSNQPTLTAPRP